MAGFVIKVIPKTEMFLCRFDFPAVKSTQHSFEPLHFETQIALGKAVDAGWIKSHAAAFQKAILTQLSKKLEDFDKFRTHLLKDAEVTGHVKSKAGKATTLDAKTHAAGVDAAAVIVQKRWDALLKDMPKGIHTAFLSMITGEEKALQTRLNREARPSLGQYSKMPIVDLTLGGVGTILGIGAAAANPVAAALVAVVGIAGQLKIWGDHRKEIAKFVSKALEAEKGLRTGMDEAAAAVKYSMDCLKTQFDNLENASSQLAKQAAEDIFKHNAELGKHGASEAKDLKASLQKTAAAREEMAKQIAATEKQLVAIQKLLTTAEGQIKQAKSAAGGGDGVWGGHITTVGKFGELIEKGAKAVELLGKVFGR